MAFKSKIAVVGQSKRAFNHFIDQIDRDDRKKFQFVCCMDGVRAMRFNQAVRLYDSHKLRDIDDIVMYLEQSLRRENG